MSQTTPGPWTLRGPSSGRLRGFDDGGDYAIIADGQIIAEVIRRTSETTEAPAEANARLIAQAPAMREALERMLSILTPNCKWTRREKAHSTEAWKAEARAILKAVEGPTDARAR